MTDGESLDLVENGKKVGSWWPISSSAVEISTTQRRLILTYLSDDRWRDTISGECFTWKSLSASKKRQRASEAAPYFRTPSRGATRSCTLPLSPLDEKHRPYLDALSLRVCVHQDVGRVLVTTRSFEPGEIVICCSVPSTTVKSEEDITSMVPSSDVPGSYLLVPRIESVFYNPEFSFSDPIQSGDIWYLVNHSDSPNCELRAEIKGASRLMLRAKRSIGEHEPLTWLYNSTFFADEDEKVDLPTRVIPDSKTVWEGAKRVLKPQVSLCLDEN